MNKETILKSDVLDILFDQRNKAYGAYDLRKFYNNRLVKSLSFMLTGAIILSAFTFLPNKKIVLDKPGVLDVRQGNIADTKKEKEPEKKDVQKPKKEKLTNEAKLLDKIIITRDPISDTIKTIDDHILIGSHNVKIPGDGPSNPPIVIPPGDGGGDGKGPIDKPVAPTLDLTKTFTENEVDIMPSYPGGMNALRQFLERNLTNPKDMEEGDEVSVHVKFVVSLDGKLQSFVTVKDGGEEFNNEVMRVLKKMPNWIPGKAKGQNVSVYYTIPVKFIPAG